MAEFQPIDPQTVDRTLGDGVHAAWQQLQQQFLEEKARAEENRLRYWEGWASRLRGPLDADLAVAAKAADDYQAFLARVSSERHADAGEGERIRAVLALAVELLGSVNDLLDEVFALRIPGLLTALAGAKLEVEARSLTQRLLRLQEEFDKAARECKESAAQPAIAAAVAAAIACAQPLRWLTDGAGGLARLIHDNYLGHLSADAMSSNPGSWGARGDTRFDTALSAWEKYIALSSKRTSFATPAGGTVAVEGFLFEVDVVAPSYSRRRQLKQLVEETREYHQWYVARLKSNLVILAGLPQKFAVLGRNVQKRPNGWTGRIRQRLEMEIQETGYRPQT